jgi:hypothetical protein
MSTNVGFALAACFPPALSSGKPWRVRTLSQVRTSRAHQVISDHTLESLSEVATKQTSLCLVTSQAREPSKSLTWEMGFVARSLANSAGGSGPEAREKGKLGASDAIV